VASDPHDRLGEGARLAGVASEDHDARIKSLASQEGVAPRTWWCRPGCSVPRGGFRPRTPAGRPGHRETRAVRSVENANDPVQLDLGYPAERRARPGCRAGIGARGEPAASNCR